MEKTVKKSNSKRNISKLHENFRESICDYALLHNLKCAHALLVLKATGCRPDELQKGVRVNIKGDVLTFKIIGSKYNVKMKRGIAIREIKVKINEDNAKYLNPLKEIFEKNPGAYDYKVSVDSKVAFTGYITKISKRLWPRKKNHASAYSFRHAKATELKNSDKSDIEIAQIMGHASTRAQQSYGRRNRRSNVGSLDICDVETSSKPRGGDRLLRFKISNKNKASQKLSEGISASQPVTTAPVRKLKR